MGSGLGAPERMNLSLVTDKLCLSEHRIHPKLSGATDVTSSVTALVTAACNIDQSDLRANADFSFLGVDSLMSIEIAQSLRTMFLETKLDIRNLCHCRMVEQLVDEIRAMLLTPITSTTVTRSASGASSPRTLVFDDGQLTYPKSNPFAHETYNVKEIISSILDININDIWDDQELIPL
jgi:acyl carrier protein